MPTYQVLTPLRRDGKVIKPGGVAGLTKEEAQPLLACGAVAPVDDTAEGSSDDLVAAIGTLPKDNDKAWLKDGRPDAKALADLTGQPVTAAERDAAWEAFKAATT